MKKQAWSRLSVERKEKKKRGKGKKAKEVGGERQRYRICKKALTQGMRKGRERRGNLKETKSLENKKVRRRREKQKKWWYKTLFFFPLNRYVVKVVSKKRPFTT